MRTFVIFSVLWKYESFRTVLALIGLHLVVRIVMAPQRILAVKHLVAPKNVALKDLRLETLF